MTLARKGSRSLIVDGTAYRWSVRRRPTYCQEMGWSPLSFAVVASDDGQCTLHVQTHALRADSVASLTSAEVMAVTPSLVARSIQIALTKGWTPFQPGSAFELQLSTDAAPQSASQETTLRSTAGN